MKTLTRNEIFNFLKEFENKFFNEKPEYLTEKEFEDKKIREMKNKEKELLFLNGFDI